MDATDTAANATAATATTVLLARKKKTRSGHRASTTRLIHQAMAAMEEDVDTDQLSLTKQMIVEKVETLKVLDGELAELVPDDDLEEEIQRIDEYKEKVYGVLAKLNKALGPTTTPPPIAITTPTMQRGLSLRRQLNIHPQLLKL